MTISSLRGLPQQALDDIRTPRGYVALGALLVALFAPLIFAGYPFSVFMQAVVFVLVVASWNLVAGYFGVFSFAHAALFGVGGYTGAILAGMFGVPAILAILLGGLGAALVSLVIAPLMLRLSGSYVAMVTLAFAEILYLSVYVLDDVTGGAAGYISHPSLFGENEVAFYYVVLAVVLANLAVMYGLLRSRFGLVGRAIREEEAAAEMLGNDTYRYKLAAFVLSAAMAGMAGGLHAYNLSIFSPSMMAIEMMIEFMAMAVIGGIGSALGPVVGVAVVVGLSEGLRSLGDVRLLVWGLLLIFIVLYFPGGLAGSTAQKNTFRDLAERLRGLGGASATDTDHTDQ